MCDTPDPDCPDELLTPSRGDIYSGAITSNCPVIHCSVQLLLVAKTFTVTSVCDARRVPHGEGIEQHNKTYTHTAYDACYCKPTYFPAPVPYCVR